MGRLVTRELILSMRSKRGGWTRNALAALGVEWPPRHGWIERAIGKPVDERLMTVYQAGVSRRQRLDDIPLFPYDDE